MAHPTTTFFITNIGRHLPVEQKVLLEEISQLTRSEPNISFRTVHELKRLAKKNEIWCVFQGEQLAGFVMATPLSQSVCELHGLYFKPTYRGQGQAHALITHIFRERPGGYFIATFLEPIRDRFLHAYSFSLASLHDLSLRERIRFLWPRLLPHRLKEVWRHKQHHTLYYLIKKPA